MFFKVAGYRGRGEMKNVTAQDYLLAVKTMEQHAHEILGL